MAIPICMVNLPIRASSTEDVIEPPIAATGMASVATPQASGENPSPPWNMTLSAIIMPPIAPMNPTTTASPATYGRRRRIEGSTSGARPWRDAAALEHGEGRRA